MYSVRVLLTCTSLKSCPLNSRLIRSYAFVNCRTCCLFCSARNALAVSAYSDLSGMNEIVIRLCKTIVKYGLGDVGIIVEA